MKKLPFVSILIPTTFYRLLFLKQLLKYIYRQEYTGNKEVIILNDGNEDIKDIDIQDNIKCKLVNLKTKNTIGYKRNFLNELAKGDILIYFDDDDYHLPTRISHTVESLIGGNNLIAGSSRSLVFKTSDKKIYEFGPYGRYHSGAGSMGFFKEYIKNHRFDESKNNAEESSFTKNFTEPMNQLDAEKTILVVHHKQNTFDKNLSTKRKLSIFQKEYFFKYDEDLKFYQNLQ